MFLVTSKPTRPTVFNLQALDWVHCEEERGVYAQLSRNIYKLVIKKLQIFKVFYFAKKIHEFQKILSNLLFIFLKNL